MATSIASTSSVTIDALPYYDTDIDSVPGLRERLEAEIEQELQQRTRGEQQQGGEDDATLGGRVPPELPPMFSTSAFLAGELDRVSNKRAAKGLDGLRYTLPAPSLSAPASAWSRAIDNAGAQLEHQASRLNNLDLMNKYAANGWRVSNYLLEKEVARLQTRVDNVKDATEEVNRERKARQLEAGSQLQALEARWQTLVSGNLQLELANLQVEMELDGLREREEELKAALQKLQQA